MAELCTCYSPPIKLRFSDNPTETQTKCHRKSKSLQILVAMLLALQDVYETSQLNGTQRNEPSPKSELCEVHITFFEFGLNCNFNR